MYVAQVLHFIVLVTKTLHTTSYTVEPPNKGHFGDSPYLGGCPLFRDQKRIKAMYDKGIWRSVLCREVVPFSECSHR